MLAENQERIAERFPLFHRVKNDHDIHVYIEEQNKSMHAMGFTEHSFAHIGVVADRVGYVLETLGVDDHTLDLALTAAWMHDLGNVVNRVDHSQSGALMTFYLLDKMGIPAEDIAPIVRAIGNHDEGSGVPVIVVSAKDDLDSKVDVLSIGADDYVTKPFEIKEVVARMRVQLRKRTAAAADTLSFGGISMDREHFTVTADGAEVPKLTRQEYRILELLVQHPTRVYSKDAIYEYAWQEPYVGETKTLDVHMSNLRKKLKQVSEKEYIETIWGIGYRMKS